MKTELMLSALALILCGCAGIGTCTEQTGGTADAARPKRIDCRSVRIEKVFGVDDAVLADTNRFCSTEEPYVYKVTLPKPFCGCSKMTFFLNDVLMRREEGSPLRLRSVSLKRILNADTGADELETEYRKTCEAVAKILGTEVGPVGLESPEAFRGHSPSQTGWGMRSYVYFDLADGQKVSVTAIDAIYTKRGNEFNVSAPAAVEIDFTYNPALFGRRFGLMLDSKAKCGQGNSDTVKSINVGPDCAELLSASIKDKGCRFLSPRKERKVTKKSGN